MGCLGLGSVAAALLLYGSVLNTFRNGVLTTLGKLNAESFYDEAVRISAIKDAEAALAQRFAERGFKVERLLLRGFR